MPGSGDSTVLRMLGSVPLFSSLSERQRKTLAETGKERSYAAGASIVKRGDKGVGFYLVLDGKADVRKDNKSVAALGPGQFFGEMALFDEQPRTADVVAEIPTRCLVLSSWEFWGALSKEPEVLRSLMQEMVRRLRAPVPTLSE
ncbi:MAG: cyclic nucleotide-binding domain-containing protein [Thermoplasmata archaeon]|nr:cyclic nucleotide-binding domain-containing protein [Thermoplasmata archaeon]